jgi:hypothetical protein
VRVYAPGGLIPIAGAIPRVQALTAHARRHEADAAPGQVHLYHQQRGRGAREAIRLGNNQGVALAQVSEDGHQGSPRRHGSLKGTTAGLLLLGVAISTSGAVAQPASDMDAVKAANRAFYTALSARDVGTIQKVWSSDPDIQNIGPGDKAIGLGWDGAKKSYEGRK